MEAQIDTQEVQVEITVIPHFQQLSPLGSLSVLTGSATLSRPAGYRD